MRRSTQIQNFLFHFRNLHCKWRKKCLMNICEQSTLRESTNFWGVLWRWVVRRYLRVLLMDRKFLPMLDFNPFENDARKLCWSFSALNWVQNASPALISIRKCFVHLFFNKILLGNFANFLNQTKCNLILKAWNISVKTNLFYNH